MHAAFPPDEDKRLACLESLALLDTEPEPAFEQAVRLAQTLSGADIALVSLVDRDRQWFKARIGIEACETPRGHAFCAHAILAPEPLWIEDARSDSRFSDNPLVTGAPAIRFYAGAPITLDGGQRIGTVCVIDPRPRSFDPAVSRGLTDLAGMVAEVCALRLARGELLRANAVATAKTEQLRLAIETADLGVWEASYRDRTLRYHRIPTDLFDWNPGYEDVANHLANVVHDDDRPAVEAAWHEHLRTGAPFRCEYRVKRRDGRLVWVCSAATVLRDADGAPERVFGVMHDVTEHRLMLRDLADAREAAEHASRLKSEFLGDMSHELRTPLNGVLGLSSALARTPLNADQAALVKLIERSGATLNRLLGEVFARFVTPEPETAPATVAAINGIRGSSPSLRRPRVLLADDHAVNRKVVELILSHLDVELTMVEDGAQAVEAFWSGAFDLVLMDINMPVMDGLTAMRCIRAMEQTQNRRTPILAVTANALPEQVAATLAAGADGHVAKPVTAEGLTDAVLAALDPEPDVLALAS